MQASDKLNFLEWIGDPRPEPLSDEEVQKAKARFALIKKMLVAMTIEGAVIAREYPIPDGLITIGEAAYALEFPDYSYLWISYHATLVNGGSDFSLVGITVEEHAADDQVVQRHHYFVRDDGPVSRMDVIGPFHTTDRYCQLDEDKYVAYYLSHPDESVEVLGEINNEARNTELAVAMGYNGQPVGLDEIKSLQGVLRYASNYAFEPRVAS